jgi:hypothetical protein
MIDGLENGPTINIPIAIPGGGTVVRDLNEIDAGLRKVDLAERTLASTTAQLTASQRALAAQGVTLDQVLAAVNQETVKGTKAKQEDRAATESLNAARRAQVQLGEQMAAAIQRERNLYLQHSEALDINARRSAALGQAAGGAGTSLNSLRGPLTSLTSQLASLNPTAASAASVLGNFAIGAAPMIAILGGVAALSFAYDHLTESVRKAAEEQKRVQQVGADFLNGIGRPAGDIGAAVTGLSEDNARIDRERAPLQARYDSLVTKRDKDGVEGLGLAIGSLYEQIQRLNKAYDLNAAKIGALRSEMDRLSGAKHLAEQMSELEVQHLHELNVSYDRAGVVLQAINTRYETRAAKIQNATQYIGAELVAMDRLVDAHAREVAQSQQLEAALRRLDAARANSTANDTSLRGARAASELAEAEQRLAIAQLSTAGATERAQVSLDRLRVSQSAEAKRVAAEAQLRQDSVRASDADIKAAIARYDATLKTIAAEEALAAAAADRAASTRRAISDETALATALDKARESYAAQTKTLAELADAARAANVENQAKAWRDAGEAARGMIDVVRTINTDVGSIATGVLRAVDSLRSFRQIQKAASANDVTADASASGVGLSATLGVAVPIIGGFASAIAGLISAADQQRAAAKALKEAASAYKDRETAFVAGGKGGVGGQLLSDQLEADKLLRDLHDLVMSGAIGDSENGARQAAIRSAQYQRRIDTEADFWTSIGEQFNALSGPAGEFLNSLNAIERAWVQQRKDADALKASTEELTRIDELRDAKIRDLISKAEQQASSSLLSGIDGGTFARDNKFNAIIDPLRQIGDPNVALFERFAQYLKASDDNQRRIAEESERANFFAQIQTSIAQQDLQLSQEQLRVSEASVSGLQQTVAALARYSTTLNLSDISPLNARQRYDVAKNSFESLVAKALSGDRDAAESITSGAGDAFLRESRNRFSSGLPYAADFTRVESVTELLQNRFGTQLTVQEQLLAEAKKHTALLEKQTDTSKSQLVEQLVQRANDHPDADTGAQVTQALRKLGFALGGQVGHKFAYEGYFGGNAPGQGNTGVDSTIYNPGYQAYLDAQGGNVGLDYQAWLAAGQPAYAKGTSWHRGGMALIGERGPELLNLPRGSSVTNNEQFSAPIVAALRQEIGRLREDVTAELKEHRREARSWSYAYSK